MARARERQCIESRHDAKPLLTPMRVFGVFFGGRTRNKLCDVVQKGVLGGLQTQTQSGCGGGEILKRSHFAPNNTIGNDWEEIQGRKKKTPGGF